MTKSANLDLPFIAPAQAQKHVTHNEAIRALDAIVQLSILDRDLAAPPVTPQDGDRYIVAAFAIGDWTGKESQVAAWQDGAWQFYTPQEGWLAWISDEDTLVAWDGSAWNGVSGGGGGGGGGSVNPVSLVGVNATADTTNRLSVTSPATLFNHEGDDHQLKINKNLAADTASLLYQTGFSGRAEMGLTGDDDFHFKVSGDGSAWNEAIVIDRNSGEVAFPNTSLGGGGGALVQHVHGSNKNWISTSTLIPSDDTIPQIGEGAHAVSVSITPASTDNILVAQVNFGFITLASSGTMVAALFRDAGPDALAGTAKYTSGYNSFSFNYSETATSTSSQTFSVRFGPSSSNTMYLNGGTSSRLFGGISAVTIDIWEIAH